jgi:hypothetical protein
MPAHSHICHVAHVPKAKGDKLPEFCHLLGFSEALNGGTMADFLQNFMLRDHRVQPVSEGVCTLHVPACDGWSVSHIRDITRSSSTVTLLIASAV